MRVKFDAQGNPELTAGMNEEVTKLNSALRTGQWSLAYVIAEGLEEKLYEVRNAINEEQALGAKP